MWTLSALLSVTEEIREHLDEGRKVCSVFSRLKAFDAVKPDTLIRKLESYGLRGSAAKLSNSHLSEGNHFVEIEQSVSSTLKTHRWCTARIGAGTTLVLGLYKLSN